MLKQRALNEYNNKIKNIFNLLTINGKYQVIGSSNLKAILYNSDYDLQEYIKGDITSDKIAKYFKDKFIKAEQEPNIYITDFKCGLDSNNEPLRWDKIDMKKGYKIMKNKNKILLKDCVMEKTTLKLDIIALINGIYTEYSENYYIKIGDESNYNTDDMNKQKIKDSIYLSYEEHISDSNYYKSLKRIFAILKIENKNKKDIKLLINYFNGQTGLLNSYVNELSILELVLNQKFKSVNLDHIFNNLQIIKQGLGNIYDIKIKQTIYDYIDELCKINKKTKLFKCIEKLKLYLFKKVNNDAELFIKKYPQFKI